MKFTVDVECTPVEARSFLGLPDLTPIQDHYVKAVLDTVSGGANIEQMETLLRSLSPFGDAGVKMFSKMMDIGMGAAGVKKG